MEEIIREFTGLFFDDLPYSEETEEARAAAEKALLAERAGWTVEDLAAKYGSLEKLAVLAGFPAEKAQAWRDTGTVQNAKAVRQGFRSQRWLAYLTAALFALSLGELVWVVYNAIFCNTKDFFFTLLISVLLIGAGLLCLRKFRRAEREHTDERYDTETFHFLRDRSDRYAKQLLNAIALLFGAATLFVGSELSFYFFGNSKSAELAENIFSNLIFVQLPLYLVIKNTLILRLLQKRIHMPDDRLMRRHATGLAIFSAVYWVLVTAATLVFREKVHYPANLFLAAGIVFFLLVLCYDLWLRRRITFRNLVFNPRRVALVSAIVLLVGGYTLMSRETYYTQPYINSLPVVEHNTDKISYDNETGVYTLTAAEKEFKILHLTDIHLGGSLFSYRQDHKALAACYALIEHTHPDLVVVTGDLCFPLGIMSMSFNNSAPVYQFASFMRNLGVPWAFTYGNHDTESLASLDKQELNEVYKSLSFKTSGTLLYPYVQPEITGRNNQVIELRNADGSLMTALFLIDSNAYTGEGINVYDYIHDDQVDWYAGEVERLNAEEGQTVSSMVFFHIPLQQYRTAYELYESGSKEVTYFFGENGEKMINKICCSDYPSKLFDCMVSLGSTKGAFCGHDHYNNMSLEYKGIRLTYGMSIDYLAMPGIENDTAQRGGELITVHPDGSWELKQIPLTSLAGYRE